MAVVPRRRATGVAGPSRAAGRIRRGVGGTSAARGNRPNAANARGSLPWGPVSDLRPVEIWSDVTRLTGEIEVVPPARLSDVVNAVTEYLELRGAAIHPLGGGHPVLSRREDRVTVAKAAAIAICPTEPAGATGSAAMWREKTAVPVTITTRAYVLVADVHLEPRRSLRDHLERYRGDFLPLTRVSALWVAGLAAETLTLQRPFALLNPAAILAASVVEG